MGYHSIPGRMAVYSRDGSARALRLLQDLLKQVREGTFAPDVSRSGRFPFKPPVVEVKDEEAEPADFPNRVPAPASFDVGLRGQGAEAAEDSGADSSSSVATTKTSSSSNASSAAVDEAPELKAPEAPEGMTFIRHKKIRVLHFVKEGYAHVMVCGKMIGQQHVRPEHAAFGQARFDSQVCRQRRRDAVKVI